MSHSHLFRKKYAMSGSLIHAGTVARQNARALSRRLAGEAAFLDHCATDDAFSSHLAAAIRRSADDTRSRAREKLLDASHAPRLS